MTAELLTNGIISEVGYCGFHLAPNRIGRASDAQSSHNENASGR